MGSTHYYSTLLYVGFMPVIPFIGRILYNIMAELIEFLLGMFGLQGSNPDLGLTKTLNNTFSFFKHWNL